MLSRRQVLRYAASLPFVPVALTRLLAARTTGRVRPSDPEWPTSADWSALRRAVDGNLLTPPSPLEACRNEPGGSACRELIRELKNPYFIGDSPTLTQTCGWVDAWTAQASPYVAAVRNAAHVAAAVNFAREKNLRLVVKGGGHSYLGTSNAPDSLMVWTHAMNDITVHDRFVGRDCEVLHAPQPAVSIGGGAIWMHAYAAVTTDAGRYVQGGGCGTVGVAGLVQSGGFGTYSKRFATAGASLIEAEVVTADGTIRVVNACREPDLFWALKGGGGGTFGVVTRVTLRTWDLPSSFGLVVTTVQADSDDAFRRLIERFVSFYADSLFNPHWGELAELHPDNRLRIAMNFQGLDKAQATAIWRPFLAWIEQSPDLRITPFVALAGPGRDRWNGARLEAGAPGAIVYDDRPGAPKANFYWSANRAEAGHVIHGFESLWLSKDLLAPDRQRALVDTLTAASRHWTLELHFQKGLAGAPAEALAATKETPINPAVLDAFALVIVAGEGPPAFPGLAGHEPNVDAARRNAARIAQAAAALRRLAPQAGSYVAESSYFEKKWQDAYWGPNYPRLLAVKKRYDPDGLFFVRHGVGSEEWSDDGFTRLALK